MMLYRVEVGATGWQRSGNDPRSGTWQVVTQRLGAGQRLYVEVWRSPEAKEVQVSVARIDKVVLTRAGGTQWRTVKTLRPVALELVERQAAGAP